MREQGYNFVYLPLTTQKARHIVHSVGISYAKKLDKPFSNRLNRFSEERHETLGAYWGNKPTIDSEPSEERKLARIQAAANVEYATAREIARFADLDSLKLPEVKRAAAESIQGSTNDFLSVGFLEQAIAVARTVARITFQHGAASGSGFLISDRLLLTNNHVIPDSATARDLMAEFEYELDGNGTPKIPTRFEFDPALFFMTDSADDLDYTIVGIGRKISGPRTLQELGFCQLLPRADKHSLGEFVNVIQHPHGRLKQVVLRENQLVSRGDRVLHYVADTQEGSSGSPVCNDQWQVVALHHFGKPHLETDGPNGGPITLNVNEGIRISSILQEVRNNTPSVNVSSRKLIEHALRGESTESTRGIIPSSHAKQNNAESNHPDSSASISMYLPISVTLGAEEHTLSQLGHDDNRLVAVLTPGTQQDSEYDSQVQRQDLLNVSDSQVSDYSLHAQNDESLTEIEYSSEKPSSITLNKLKSTPKKEDLTIIKGIAESTQKLLNANQIFTYTDLRDSNSEKLVEILEAAGHATYMIESWSLQAALASDSQWEALSEYQSTPTSEHFA